MEDTLTNLKFKILYTEGVDTFMTILLVYWRSWSAGMGVRAVHDDLTLSSSATEQVNKLSSTLWVCFTEGQERLQDKVCFHFLLFKGTRVSLPDRLTLSRERLAVPPPPEWSRKHWLKWLRQPASQTASQRQSLPPLPPPLRFAGWWDSVTLTAYWRHERISKQLHVPASSTSRSVASLTSSEDN